MSTGQPLLEVEGLTTTFSTDNGELTAVDGIDFAVDEGETVCIVGESGSGKTVATESVTRIVKEPPGRVEGSVRFKGRDLLGMSEPDLRQIRGYEIAHIFQNPQEAMNHCYSVGWQIVEALQIHRDISDEFAVRRLPARVLRRPETARDDRDGARRRPGSAHRRRADDGP